MCVRKEFFTNGKTTVTSVAADMLVASGHDAVAAGNIGNALSDLVASPPATIVVLSHKPTGAVAALVHFQWAAPWFQEFSLPDIANISESNKSRLTLD